MTLKKLITGFATLSLLGSSTLLPAKSESPSELYKNKSDCIESPEFVTPKSEAYKYCIKSDGAIQKIDIDGVVTEEEGKLDALVENKTKKGGFRRTSVDSLSEFKIEENELIEYRCKAKKVKKEIQCDGASERSIKGVRPKGYYLDKGLNEIEDKNWKESIKYFDDELDLNKNVEAYYYRAFSKLMLEDFKGVIQDADLALKIDSNYLKAFNVRSIAKFELKDFKGAISDLDRLTTLYETLTAKEIEELEIDDINETFDKFYFRRGLAKSEIGDSESAKADFIKEIDVNPLFGQAYFQKGLEQYWTNRDAACNDLLKGISLGARDTSDSFINQKGNSDSFLDELFDNEITLIKTCKDSSTKKADLNKQNYETENLIEKAYQLGRKYVLLVPIFLVIIISIIIKYAGNNDSE